MSFKTTIKSILEGLPQKVKIGSRYVGPGESTFVIAEVGINHNGDIAVAKQLIDAAADAGADAVKFQKRTTKDILTKEGLDKPYDSPNAFAATYGAHREKLEFSEEQYAELKQYANKKNILFFASVWDPKSADFMERLGIDAYKIPSADLINTPLLEYVAQKGKPVLLSTGMSTLEEIDTAVDAILRHNNRLVLFHCTSLYPCPDDKIDMRFMGALRTRFSPLPVGYSGHEAGLLPTIVAVSRSAQIVERHLTLDKNMRGSDHKGSLEPQELTELVNAIKNIEVIKGEGRKVLYEELTPLREKLAKSLVARIAIPQGTVITENMLTIKGPGNGIKPSSLHEVVGRVARTNIPEDGHVPLEALRW